MRDTSSTEQSADDKSSAGATDSYVAVSLLYIPTLISNAHLLTFLLLRSEKL